MTSYIAITDAETDPSAPLTAELAKKWRDNPIAISEGSTGAPRIQGKALGGIRQTLLTVTGTSYATLTGLDSYKWIDLQCSLDPDSTASARDCDVQLSTDGGSTWTTARTVFRHTFSSATNIKVFVVSIGLQDGAIFTSWDENSLMFFDETNANYNAVRIRQSSSNSTNNVLNVVPYFWEAKV